MAEVDTEREYWDAQAADDPDWAAWAEEGDGVEECLAFVEPAIDLAAPFGAVLDLGCGAGRLLVPLAARRPNDRFIGVDISRVMVEEARRRVGDNVRILLGNGRVLPEVGELRAAYSVLMFQHIPDEAAVDYLDFVHDELVYGGAFVFQYVSGKESSFLNRHRGAAEVEMWCTRAGFEVREHRKGGVHPSWNWVTAVKS